MTGTIAISLTACGGGGGGGSSTPVNPPQPPKDVVDIGNTDKEISFNGKDVVINGNITSNSQAKNFIGVTATNSNIDLSKDSKISTQGEGSIGIKGTQTSKTNYTITNNGNIILSGKNSIGMLVENGVIGINNGVINTDGDGFAFPIEDDQYHDFDYELGGTGMKAQNGSTIINNGDIISNGSFSRGMYANNKSKAENNGKIQFTSKKQNTNDKFLPDYSIEIGMKASNDSTITNNKLITGKGEGSGMHASNNSQAINFGNIELESIPYTVETIGLNVNYLTSLDGLYATQNSKAINNGNIRIEGRGYGITVNRNSSGINNGKIHIIAKPQSDPKGTHYTGIYGMHTYLGDITNNKDIILENHGIGMSGSSANVQNFGNIHITTTKPTSDSQHSVSTGIEIVNSNRDHVSENNGSIVITGNDNMYGIALYNSHSDIKNNGDIELEGSGELIIGINDVLQDIDASSRVIENNSNIRINQTNLAQKDSTAIGIFNSSKTINNGSIAINAESTAYGIIVKGDNKTITNSKTGIIDVVSKNGSAYGIFSNNSNIINDGVINVNGNNKNVDGNYSSVGIIIAGKNGVATNNGTINVDGNGGYGIQAMGGAKGINSESGIINVSATADGAMIADGEGSYVENRGTINIDKNNSHLGTIENGVEVAALKAINGGTIKNLGTINSNGDFSIDTSKGGVYVIGTTTDGDYGKITGDKITLNGDISVDTTITTNGFKNEYTMQNVVDGDEIVIGDEFTLTSNSLLYDVDSVIDTWGNMDAILTRNDKNLSDFSMTNLTSTAKIFEKYQNEEGFKELSSDAKKVIGMIDTSNVAGINNSLRELTPTIYANLSRQIFNINDTFNKYDSMTINSLGNNPYTFSFIGEYSEIDSKNIIEGYKNTMSGFVGAMNFGNSLYGTLGYGYSDIDYDGNSKGNIQTIHLGLNKFDTFNGLNTNLSLFGEYNFHENTRVISGFNRTAESDFNSYLVGVSGEISKTYKSEVDIKPFVSLDMSYSSYDSIRENGANSINVELLSEDYFSFKPSVGINIEKNWNNLKVFSQVNYSYELGDINKTQYFSYEGFQGKGTLVKDDLEKSETKIEIGSSYSIDNFYATLSFGKKFGERDDIFSTLSLMYRF